MRAIYRARYIEELGLGGITGVVPYAHWSSTPASSMARPASEPVSRMHAMTLPADIS
ncbi:hypothetical protein [Azospirillum palustre]